MAFLNNRKYIESVIKDLDIKLYLLLGVVYLAKIFHYIAKSVFFVFFYKEKKEKSYDEEQLFI